MTNTELRRLAEASQAQDPEWWGPRLQSLLVGEVPDRTAELDAELIRACSPDVIIALLDRCEALEKERDAWKRTALDAGASIASAHAAKGGE